MLFRSLREGRRVPQGVRGIQQVHFNSRPSARGDHQGGQNDRAAQISIHAPPRGATRQVLHHARAVYFNSRPSARGDTFNMAKYAQSQISIHAPPRGATARAQLPLRPAQKFQFTPLREGRLRRRASSCSGGVFQFTPLREGRPAVLRVVFFRFVFQFTPLREGRRHS